MVGFPGSDRRDDVVFADRQREAILLSLIGGIVGIAAGAIAKAVYAHAKG
jgi:hypothetical protein